MPSRPERSAYFSVTMLIPDDGVMPIIQPTMLLLTWRRPYEHNGAHYRDALVRYRNRTSYARARKHFPGALVLPYNLVEFSKRHPEIGRSPPISPSEPITYPCQCCNESEIHSLLDELL